MKYGDEQMPDAGGNGAGQIGWSGVGFADGEVAFVAAALSTKALRIGGTQIERRVLLLAGVAEIDADAMSAGGHGKGNLEVGLVLRTFDFAGEYEVRGRALGQRVDREDREEKTGRCCPTLARRQEDSFTAAWHGYRAGAAFGCDRMILIPHPRLV